MATTDDDIIDSSEPEDDVTKAEESSQDRVNVDDLVELAQTGDYVAQAQLDTLFRYMIVKIANDVYYNTSYNGLEIDDLRSVGQISFYDAIKSFRRGKSPFPAYAKLIVERGIRNCSKEQMGLGRQYLNTAVSLDTPIQGEDSNLILLDTLGEDDSYIACTTLKDDDIEHMEEYFEKRFSSIQTMIMKYILQGYNNEEIIKMMGKSRKAYYNELRAIRKILES